MSDRRRCLASACAAVLTAGFLTSTTAHADAGVPSLHSVTKSTGFAGYAANTVLATVTVSSGFTVPAITCRSSSEGIAPAVILADSSVSYDSAGVAELCPKGNPAYTALVQFDQKVTMISAVKPGDRMTVSITQSSGSTTVTVKDTTAKWSKSYAGAGGSPGYIDIGVDDWVNFSTGAIYGVPTFTKVTFSASRVNGASLAGYRPTQYERVSSTGVVQIASSGLSSTGTSFGCTFRHN